MRETSLPTRRRGLQVLPAIPLGSMIVTSAAAAPRASGATTASGRTVILFSSDGMRLGLR